MSNKESEKIKVIKIFRENNDLTKEELIKIARENTTLADSTIRKIYSQWINRGGECKKAETKTAYAIRLFQENILKDKDEVIELVVEKTNLAKTTVLKLYADFNSIRIIINQEEEREKRIVERSFNTYKGRKRQRFIFDDSKLFQKV